MHHLIPDSILKLRELASEVTRTSIAPLASEVDSRAHWPEHSMRALADANLMGLHVPKRLGGHEQGLLALAVIGEAIGQGCTSSAMCYNMHCVATAVIAAKATSYHEERYLEPIAQNRHITTLALSESGTGAHFYVPQTELTKDGQFFSLNGRKDFVTNAGHADSYVVSTLASSGDIEAGDFSCLILDDDKELQWLDPWHGLGMRGNCSRSLLLNGVQVPVENLLGDEGDQIWYTFEVVAPFFLIGMAGAYLGLAQAAFDAAKKHVLKRHYSHNGESLAEVSTIQHRIAEMGLALEKCRGLVYQAAYCGDIGDANAMTLILMAKADSADLAVKLSNEAMTCCGGMAYRENSDLARMLRDARAAHVMSPTTDLLKLWTGRLLLDLPLI